MWHYNKFASKSFRLFSKEVFLLFVGEAAGFTEEEVDKKEKHKADEGGHEKEGRVVLPREQGLQRDYQEDYRDIPRRLHQHVYH